jgi:hypothetical protein
MKSEKADPRKPINKDSQGHAYQHELGDPDRAAQLEESLNEARERAAAVSKDTATGKRAKKKSQIVTRKRR